MKPQYNQFGNKNMQYVAAVEKHKNISAAAESLFISQPALSRFIHSLEKRIGIKLFNRFGNQYIPTYEGERYLYHAKRIIAVEMQLENEFAALFSDRRGRLRLALPILRSAHILPLIIPQYNALHPNVKIILHEENSRKLEGLLVDGEVDFAFINAETKHPDIIHSLTLREKLLVAIPPGHKLFGFGVQKPSAAYPAVDISQLSGDRFILQEWNQRTRQAAESIFSEAKMSPDILLVTRSNEVSLKLVCNGLGVCFVPETYAKHITLPSPVSFFSLRSSYATFNIYLAHMKNIYHPQYFDDFIRISRDNL